MSAAVASPTRPRDETVLADLLARGRAFGCEFGHCLANHLPMMLVALGHLGASDARLRRCFDRYAAENDLRPPTPPIGTLTADTWPEHLGKREREADLRAFFAAEVRRLGAAAVQRQALPVLLPGVAASALHALMRLGYANLTGSADEVAVALGYWAACHLTLAAPTDTPADTLDPAVILQRLSAHPALLDVRPETDLLWHAMRAVGATPTFRAVADGLATDATSLPRMAAAALALFAGAFEFCSLHAVTAIHWVRLIDPGTVDRPALLRHVWRAVAAVYPKMGMPKLPSAEMLDAMRVAPCPPWPEIAAAAVASDDEHDISLVFSAREEEAFHGDPLYRRVAARRVGLIAT